MKKKIGLFIIVLMLVVGSFFIGVYVTQTDGGDDHGRSEFLLKENLAKVVMKSDRIDRIKEEKYEEVIDTINHEIDSSLFVVAVLLDYEMSDDARLQAYRLLMRIVEQREEHPHRPVRPDFKDRIDTLLNEARAWAEDAPRFD